MSAAAELGFDEKRLARVGARMESDIKADITDGCALIVGRRGEVALRAVLGFAERETGRPLTDRDVFATMSIGKQFTSVLALTFIDRGLLHLHMRVGDLIPEFRERGLWTMSLFHLLTHTSGLESEWPSVDLETLLDISKLTAYVAGRRPEAKPGEQVTYSTMVAHSVIAEMIRRADGGRRSFTQIITEELFAPLGMNETCLGPKPDLLERLCPVKAKFKDGMARAEDIVGVNAILATKGELAAGGYMTTLDDLYRFTNMLRNKGELDGARVLSPRLVEYCTQNFTGEKHNSLWDYTRDTKGWEPWPASMGIGFWMRGVGIQPGPMSNLSSPNTFGGWGAGSTCFWVDPELDLTFTFLSVGIMEAADHVERVQRLSDLVIAAIVD
ncbi:MAG: serine hydrolase [Marinicaulis sp.]|nr:serine hydrolase [Marinicaulis sp.]NNL89603.1 serine hydrolase [Marinicaulis sp.]